MRLFGGFQTPKRYIGVYTTDFRAFHALAETMRGMGIAFISLASPEDVPPHVGVVIVTSEVALGFSPSVIFDGDPRRSVRRALQALHGRLRYRLLVVGIDPGEMPGLAVLGDGILVEKMRATCPEDAAELASRALRDYEAREKVVRIGHGDTPNRDRIIRALCGRVGRIEIVDETGTTPMPGTTDMDSAAAIARMNGERVTRHPCPKPSPGKVRDVQRLSRVQSAGKITLSKEEANAVATGLITMDEAIKRKRRTLGA